jgi:galactokinase
MKGSYPCILQNENPEQTMKKAVEKIIEGDSLYRELFGHSRKLLETKREMLGSVWKLFRDRFSTSISGDRLHLIAVPNRVELLGKHTDYQGGETLLLTGPKNFFAIAASCTDGISHFVNADTALGETLLRLEKGEPEMLSEGVGSNYTQRVATRFSRNLLDSGFPLLGNVKAVFLGDVPIGGGTSGSSAKVITDFLIFAASQELIDKAEFKELITSNGRRAGLELKQKGLNDYLLALSMYIAHYENGLDFGDLKGDRGVGTFGGSEDHTAIILGEKNRLLFCRYCPTQLLQKVSIPEAYVVVVAYSGKRAEKTKDAMAKYNRLSGDAVRAVQALNEKNGTSYRFLRDFYPELPHRERTEAMADQLKGEKSLFERAYQFFREREIIFEAVECLKGRRMEAYGRLINESHDLSKKYLKNIAAEVDYLQQSANELGALGATGFGGGFGGSCYAVIQESRADNFIGQWREKYHRHFPQYRSLTQFDVYPQCSGARWQSIDI